MPFDYRQYIIRDASICGGEPVVRDTRVTVRTILASLAEGMTVADIVKDFPTLDEEAVRAIIALAAVSGEEDLPVREDQTATRCYSPERTRCCIVKA